MNEKEDNNAIHKRNSLYILGNRLYMTTGGIKNAQSDYKEACIFPQDPQNALSKDAFNLDILNLTISKLTCLTFDCTAVSMKYLGHCSTHLRDL